MNGPVGFGEASSTDTRLKIPFFQFAVKLRPLYPLRVEIRRVYSPYVLLAAFLPFSNLSAQTTANPGSQPSASYLLIVETSRAMQPRARAVYDSVKEIIDSN